MRFLGRLAFLFVLVPVLELMLLIRIGEWVGLWPTLALVLVTGTAGAALARAEGLRVFWRFQSELAQGRLPGQALQDGIAVLLGGAFLLTPGILTDVTGLALLFPPTRRWIQKRVRKSMERRIRDGTLRVVSMRTGGFTGFGGPFGGAGPGPTDSGASDASSPERLDPAKEIRIDGSGPDGG